MGLTLSLPQKNEFQNVIYVYNFLCISPGDSFVLSWIKRSFLSKRSVTNSRVHESCDTGMEKVCNCTDGSLADLSVSPCEEGYVNLSTCMCPKGSSLQRKGHHIGKGLNKTVCECSNGKVANLNKSICGGNTMLDTCI